MKLFLYRAARHFTERDLIAARSTGRNPDNIAHLSSLVSGYDLAILKLEQAL